MDRLLNEDIPYPAGKLLCVRTPEHASSSSLIDRFAMRPRTRTAVVLGTRPEAIKLAPVIRALEDQSDEFETKVIVTGQHRHMLDQVLRLFRITPDADLAVMRPDQSLNELTALVVKALEALLATLDPDLLLVQGDTTTAFATALAGFYRNIPVAHVEAGLRSYDLRNPFPEEANRRLISVLTSLHLSPTARAAEALVREGTPRGLVAITGNTVVDALQTLVDAPFSFSGTPLENLRLSAERIILVTSHRRESWGRDLQNICLALRDIVQAFPDVAVVYPVHLNPNVRRTVHEVLAGGERVHLIEPLDYLAFINLAKRSFFILTDSGGVQEEAPTLGKPLLLLRKVTERPEAFDAGRADIVGTSRDDIFQAVGRLLTDSDRYLAMATGENPYGDGRAAGRVILALRRWRGGQQPLLSPEDEFRPASRTPPAIPTATMGATLSEVAQR